MRWPFRRKPGRHQLGAAVTAIPSSPTVRVVAAPEPPEPSVPEAVVEQAVVGEPFVEVVRPPRIELGFRDGSTAALAPGSEQAKALTDIASVLTQRDL